MTKTYSMPKNFYWGGASAANQYEGGYNEGGKGLNAIDVLTNGSATEPRKVTWKTNDGKTGVTPMTWGKEFKLAMKELIFTIIIKKILNIWLRWALICSVYL